MKCLRLFVMQREAPLSTKILKESESNVAMRAMGAESRAPFGSVGAAGMMFDNVGGVGIPQSR